MDLRTALDRVFPSARGMEVTVPVEEDGSFLAGIVLPVKHGESVVQIYRYPSTAEDRLRHEHRLSWRHPQKMSFGEGALWAFLVSWDGVASREEIWELVAQRLARNPVLGSSPDAGSVMVCGAGQHDRERLRAALGRLARDSRTSGLSLPELVAAGLPGPWRVLGHQVRLFAEVLLLRRDGSDVWGVLVLPVRIRGMPSTWQHTPPGPIPYADRSPVDRAVLLAGEAGIRVGTLADLVGSFLPDAGVYGDATEDAFEEDRRVTTGDLTVLAALLDVVPDEHRHVIESVLHEAGVATPIIVPLPY